MWKREVKNLKSNEKRRNTKREERRYEGRRKRKKSYGRKRKGDRGWIVVKEGSEEIKGQEKHDK